MFKMYLWSVSLFLLPSVCAFLLEPSNQQNSSKGPLVSSDHYVTLSRFLQAQTQQQLTLEEQHRNTEALRKSVDETFALLSSQLQGKFVDFERKLINDVKQNETFRGVDDLEKKLLELENNFTAVVYELKIARYENEKMKTVILSLKNENMKMKNQFSMLMNETHHVDVRVKSIEQLKILQSLQDLQTVKQEIQTIDSQTATLLKIQIGRNQDFLALYNKTSFDFIQADNRLQHLETFQNVSMNNATVMQQQVTNRFVAMEGRLQHLEEYKNMSLTRPNLNTAALQTHTTTNEQKVAITACQADNRIEYYGYIVKFDNVKTTIGVSDISSFQSSGKLKCEYEGLYTVSVCLTAFKTAIDYGIYLNGVEYTSVYEDDNKVPYQRGCTTVVLNLQPNDMLWVQLKGSMSVNNGNSCIAIVMIK
ncbi:Hypothetical predicted protein [Mytilus galloprovincialis]|uniref:C1q domain-containing protein n=2 Tax=Mytilus galloprovincialis TaxID=29158 RepID=A0A8B6GJ03_MYTGA|nr:Hypothetical predicted protein [Mytilus galloprovincialis]